MKVVFFLLLSLSLNAQKFTEENRTFENIRDTVTLAATITIPVGFKKPPVAILISGSGQTDRDETIFKHKIFKELAEYLSANGIAVIRYDDRGGYESTGRNTANSTSYELSEDAEQIMLQIRKDKRFKKSKIGFIGHSEGGMIVPMIAARNKNVGFIVSLAGTAVDGKTILIKQNREILTKQGVKKVAIDAYLEEMFIPMITMMANKTDDEKAKEKIIDLAAVYRKNNEENSLIPAMLTNEKFAEMTMKQMGGTWGTYFLKTNPAQFWQQVSCPVLALNGDIDTQVDMELNLPVIEKSLKDAGNKNVTITRLPNHNHLFQEAKTGSVMEYGQLEKGISETTMKLVTDWIKAL